MIKFTVYGEACSKANSREIVTIGGRPSVIKSKKALAFEADMLRQIPPAARVQLEGPVRATLRIFYASERPDLDESIVLDCMQDRFRTVKLTADKKRRDLVQKGVYRNDRQVREKHVFWGLDKRNPRIEIEIVPLQAQQLGIDAELFEEAEVQF